MLATQQNYNMRLFLVSYMLNYLRDVMSLEMYNRLYSEELAIKILVRLPPSDQERVKHLATLPNLIVESLLMDSRVERVFSIMREFPELQSDSLALTYAAKAVLFDRPRASVGSGGEPADSAAGGDAGAAPTSDDEAPVFTTPDHRLTGDPENDNAVREMFRYRQVGCSAGVRFRPRELSQA